MICYSGEPVYVDGKGAPSLFTIGVALGRIPRFCGHTHEFYTVLGHVLTVAAILPNEYALYGLLHDAQESCMGDVPTPWKTEAARRREHMLLRRIYQANDLEWPIPMEAQEQVDWADREVLVAEANRLGHAGSEQWATDYNEVAYELTDYHLKNVQSYLVPDIAGTIYVEAFNHYRALAFPEFKVEIEEKVAV